MVKTKVPKGRKNLSAVLAGLLEAVRRYPSLERLGYFRSKSAFPRQNRLAGTLAPPNCLKIAIFGKKRGFSAKSDLYFANLPCLFGKQTGLNVNQNGYFAIRPRANDNQTRANDNQTRANGIPPCLIGGQRCLITKLPRSFVKLLRAFAKIPWPIGNRPVLVGGWMNRFTRCATANCAATRRPKKSPPHIRLRRTLRSFNFRSVKKAGRPIIPRKTIYRLSIYLRCLARLRENSLGTVSSEALAKAAGVKPTQLRKDLAYFGTFGTRGLGYDVNELSGKISDELGTSSLQPVILVGVGNLGLALVSYRGFEKEGFEILAAFDAEPRRKRDKEIKQPILGMDKMAAFIREHSVKMAILSVPAAAAQTVANQLIENGIMGILNFSPIVLAVPEDVMVNNVNLAIELENLSYFIQG